MDELTAQSTCIARVEGGIGLVRSYLTSVGAGKGILNRAYLSDIDSIFTNPRLRRLFCSQAPKKKSEGKQAFDHVLALYVF